MLNQHTALQAKSGTTWHKICPFPVGFIYLSATNTSPATRYGGTWVAHSDGYMWRPAGSWNGTGGKSTVTLTVAQMPAHTHTTPFSYGYDAEKGLDRVTYSQVAEARSAWKTLNSTGEGKSHENMPPYRNCYCWRRTA